MNFKEFLREHQGVASMEYVLFVAAMGIILIVGVGVLFRALGNFFTSWAGYFGGGS